MSGQRPQNDSDQPVNEFGDLFESSLDYSQPARGDIRDAEIMEIRETEIVVDLGVKRDGVVPPQDVERLDPAYFKSLRVGDVVPVYVLNPSDRDGNLVVSLNLGLQGQDWARAAQLLESGEIIEAEVTGSNRGGLLVRFGRLEGFVPTSHLAETASPADQDRRDALNALTGQTLGLKVIEVNQARRRLILSQREAQRNWRAQQKQKLLDSLKVGSIVSGRVTGIRDFGVFVDIGGADGLIHVSELDWHRVPHPKDVVKVGQQIDVYVLELDKERQRIALSLRRTQPDPWETVEETYHIDQVVEGTVSNVVDFGAFLVLDDGIEGLLHVTEMGDGTLTEPHSYVKRNDHVQVKIVRIERDRRRIGFTQKGLGIASPARSAETPEPSETDTTEPTPSEEPASTAPPEADAAGLATPEAPEPPAPPEADLEIGRAHV